MSNTDSTEKRDVYARVTDQIVTAIENGVGTWRMPWHTSGRFAFSPINIASHKPYRGINTVCLWAAAQAKGYERGEWATYQQWQDRGAQVRKGESATLVVFWKFAHDSSESQDGGTEAPAGRSRLLFTRGYSVFNAAQADGYTPKVDVDATMPERIAPRTHSFKRSARIFGTAEIRRITRPRRITFKCRRSPPSPKTSRTIPRLAHEHTHWTAPASRCDRELGKRFGDNAYAAEELIAELGAAFTCGHLGLSTEPRADHAQYIQSWLKVLKADTRAIFTAASKAQQATDWLIARVGESVRTAEVAA